MATRILTLALFIMVLAVSVQAHPGRKMQQVSKNVEGAGSAAIAASIDTSAKIEAAIDNNAKVKPSQAPKLGTTATVRTQKPAGTTTQGGALSSGTSTAYMTGTQAAISKAASGAKPSKPAAVPAPKPTTTIAGTSKSSGATSSGGVSTAAQAAASDAINKAASGGKPQRP
ncbi:hypothetical protein COO60DRAFT_1491195 [Scenedesmus sp. NREL 46B-D3]|nr:hypothetical protein COO60DRAFT_1491195 [Scenedesmus sp. NREL 46B-D3]